MAAKQNKQMWSEDQLVYRLGTCLPKAPKYPMSLVEYTDWIDNQDGLHLPFLLGEVIMVREAVPFLVELMITKRKPSLVWEKLSVVQEGEIIMFADPMLQGSESLFFCRTFDDQESMLACARVELLTRGEGMRGLSMASVPGLSKYVLSIPGSWYSLRK